MLLIRYYSLCYIGIDASQAEGAPGGPERLRQVDLDGVGQGAEGGGRALHRDLDSAGEVRGPQDGTEEEVLRRFSNGSCEEGEKPRLVLRRGSLVEQGSSSVTEVACS